MGRERSLRISSLELTGLWTWWCRDLANRLWTLDYPHGSGLASILAHQMALSSLEWELFQENRWYESLIGLNGSTRTATVRTGQAKTQQHREGENRKDANEVDSPFEVLPAQASQIRACLQGSLVLLWLGRLNVLRVQKEKTVHSQAITTRRHGANRATTGQG